MCSSVAMICTIGALALTQHLSRLPPGPGSWLVSALPLHSDVVLVAKATDAMMYHRACQPDSQLDQGLGRSAACA